MWEPLGEEDLLADENFTNPPKHHRTRSATSKPTSSSSGKRASHARVKADAFFNSDGDDREAYFSRASDTVKREPVDPPEEPTVLDTADMEDIDVSKLFAPSTGQSGQANNLQLDARAQELKERLRKTRMQEDTASPAPADDTHSGIFSVPTNAATTTRIPGLAPPVGQDKVRRASRPSASPVALQKAKRQFNVNGSKRTRQVQDDYDDIQDLINSTLQEERDGDNEHRNGSQDGDPNDNEPIPRKVERSSKALAPTGPSNKGPKHQVYGPHSSSKLMKREHHKKAPRSPEMRKTRMAQAAEADSEPTSNHRPEMRDLEDRYDRARQYDRDDFGGDSQKPSLRSNGGYKQGRFSTQYRAHDSGDYRREQKPPYPPQDGYERRDPYKMDDYDHDPYNKNNRGRYMDQNAKNGSYDNNRRGGESHGDGGRDGRGRYREPTLEDVLPYDPDLKLFLKYHNWFENDAREKLLAPLRKLAQMEAEEAARKAEREKVLAELAQATGAPTASAPPMRSDANQSRNQTPVGRHSQPMTDANRTPIQKRSYDQGPNDGRPHRYEKVPRNEDRRLSAFEFSGDRDRGRLSPPPSSYGTRAASPAPGPGAFDRREGAREGPADGELNRRPSPSRDSKEWLQQGGPNDPDRGYDSYRGLNHPNKHQPGFHGGPRHTRGPKLDLGNKGETRFFLLKSFNEQNVRHCMEDGIWTTQLPNRDTFQKAFEKCKNVIFIFSINKSRAFQGWARMETLPSKSTPRPNWMKGIHWETTAPFRIMWYNTARTDFWRVHHLKNELNENEPVLVGKDGQEIEDDCARSLLELMDKSEEIKGGWLEKKHGGARWYNHKG